MGGAQVARRYVNPAKSVALVTESTLGEAQARLDGAREQLRTVEAGDPLQPGWESEFDHASVAVRAAERRLEALTSLRAAQLERSGQRAAAVKAAGKELDSLAASLGASRDQVAAAAADHLRALAALASAVDAHNAGLAAGRARLAALGLSVRDDLVDVDQGQEHPEGTLDSGVRCGGVTWLPIPAPGLVAHALTETFGRFRGPFASMRFAWPSYQVERRPDQLAVPSLNGERPVT
jgi:hypothetical protein